MKANSMMKLAVPSLLLMLGACVADEEGRPPAADSTPVDVLASARSSARLGSHIAGLRSAGWSVPEISERSLEHVALTPDRTIGVVSLHATKMRADGKLLEVAVRFTPAEDAALSVAFAPHDDDASADLHANPPNIDFEADEVEPDVVLAQRSTGVLAAKNRCSSRVISWPNTSFACVALWSNPAGVFRRWQTFCDGGTGGTAYIAAWDGCAATVPWGGGSTRWIECNQAKPNRCGTP